MLKMRQAERGLTCTHFINFLKAKQREWLDRYLSDQAAGHEYKNLLKLLQRFCSRHGFSRQKPAKSKQLQGDRNAILYREEFAADFHRVLNGFHPDTILNVDETGIHYDMPPSTIWASTPMSASKDCRF
ncbi:Aste57867_15035 [Aphanomyces stellatus]|uniref:Aste57867_15035 protein n=1 Tax=Aphanomyces stellatus TaxID=120398 RepID=A0A485L280_9STRA|nr:hypothetical protein As57867_014979 [Aphanomyces stellatus]VFT91849.1 Aste57867_15035 [Aphanomyces stellatus]